MASRAPRKTPRRGAEEANPEDNSLSVLFAVARRCRIQIPEFLRPRL